MANSIRHLIIVFLCVYWASSQAKCGCFEAYDPEKYLEFAENKPSLIFQVISGDAIDSEDTINDSKNNLKLTTLVKILDSGTSKRDHGDSVNLFQSKNECAANFISGERYVLFGQDGGGDLWGNSCSVVHLPKDKDVEKFDAWFSANRD